LQRRKAGELEGKKLERRRDKIDKDRVVRGEVTMSIVQIFVGLGVGIGFPLYRLLKRLKGTK
jgi:hypothetical protein